VAACLDRLPDRQAALRILDLGTGTGCLLLALLSELPQAVGFGVDIAPGAARTARQNAASMSLETRAFFLAGAWGAALRGGMDMVIANPPYVVTEAISGLDPEVARHDPVRALDGGADGFAAHRELAADIQRLLRPAGFACIEIGMGQAAEASQIYAAAGLDEVGRHCDFKGIERCLVLAPRR
jgi:release factor glutamine methyltransferase